MKKHLSYLPYSISALVLAIIGYFHFAFITAITGFLIMQPPTYPKTWAVFLIIHYLIMLVICLVEFSIFVLISKKEYPVLKLNFEQIKQNFSNKFKRIFVTTGLILYMFTVFEIFYSIIKLFKDGAL